MITLKDFMETVDYRITEGSDYCWQCFGSNAYTLDFWNQDQEGHSLSIIFDTRTHVVYEATACDYRQNRAYRLVNPDYRAQHDQEARDRDVDINEAWDDVNYVDLETDEDFLIKAQAIVRGDMDYDTRVEVPLTLPDDSLFHLMKLAHEADQTLNQYVENIIRQAIENEEFARDLDELRAEYDFSDAEVGRPATMTAKKRKKSKKS
jgi:hypothetical protein